MATRRSSAGPGFFVLGVVFLYMGLSGDRTNYVGLGAGFLAIGIIFLVRQRRRDKSA